MESIDVFWSFRSPYSYLVTPDLQRLEADFAVTVNVRVVLPIAIRAKQALFKGGDRKPAMYILLDSKRRADFLGMPMVFPPKPDPVAQDYETFEVADDQPLIRRLARLGVESQRRGKGVAFVKEVSHLINSGTVDWDRGDHLANATRAAGLDLDALDLAIADGTHDEEIEQNHAALEAAGHWGVPTMVLRGEPFFGQDRIETLRWRLEQYGLRKT
ncbi:MAG: DsbA family protein [Pseudomonadota bacterium]